MLVLASVAVLVVPNILGRRSAGSPTAEVIAAPPSVGQCVKAITQSPTGRPAGADSAAQEAPDRDRALPTATVTPCTGQVVGEVISVTPRNPVTATTLQEYDDAHPDCRTQVESYLGITATTHILGVAWSKSIYVDAVTVGPDAHDRAAGRTWSACVLSAVSQTYPAPRTLKSSWTTNSLPDAYGLCWVTTVIQHGVPTACTAPHTTQQLAFGFASGATDSSTSIVSAPDPADVTTGCRQLAADIMQVRDPTFGGALEIKVLSDPSGVPFVQCAASATGGRHLVGSLIGLGAATLPLA